LKRDSIPETYTAADHATTSGATKSLQHHHPSGCAPTRTIPPVEFSHHPCSYCGKTETTAIKNWDGWWICNRCRKTLPDCCCCDRKAVIQKNRFGIKTPPIRCFGGPSICPSCCTSGLISSEQEAVDILGDILCMYEELGLSFSPDDFVSYFWSRGLPTPPHWDLTATNIILVQLVDFHHFEHNSGVRTGDFQFGRCECRGALIRDTPTLADRRWVDCIKIVGGLPKPLFASLLAHELFHAFLWLKGFSKLDPTIEEGLCNAISGLYMQRMRRITKHNGASSCRMSPASSRARTICGYLLAKMQTSTHPHFGVAYRMARDCVLSHGWRRTLLHLRVTGELLRP